MGTRHSSPRAGVVNKRLAQLVGTRVEGMLKVSVAALNELLHIEGSPLGGAVLSVAPGNRIVVRYGLLHASASAPRVVWVGTSPRLTLSLASFAVALALKVALRRPYLEVHGRRLVIHLADVPALHPWRDVWAHVRRLELAIERGGVRLTFEFSMTG